MFCASAVYRTPNERFDIEYYVTKHAPRFVELLGEHCLRWEVHTPIAIPGVPPAPFVAAGYFWVDSAEALAQTLAEHGEEIFGDVPNFSASMPESAITEVTAAG